MISAELKVVGGKHAGQVIPLNRRKFLIGREQDCQLRPNSEMVSRHHCVFSVDDYSVRLRDLGSTNGTIVNGERIRRETVLSAGDRILIGNLDFEFILRPGVSVPEADSKLLASVTGTDNQISSPTLTDVPASIAAAQTVSLPLSAISSELAAASQAVAPVAAAAPPAAPQPAAAAAPAPAIDPAAMVAQMQPQYPYPPMMPPMGYPGAMYPGYPYQQPMMPGYGQMYPQMMAPMGYPAPGMMAPAPAPAPATAPAAAAATIEVSLPDPDSTGAKESEAPKGSSGSSTKDTAKPTGAADAIIKQYMGRRPGGPG